VVSFAGLGWSGSPRPQLRLPSRRWPPRVCLVPRALEGLQYDIELRALSPSMRYDDPVPALKRAAGAGRQIELRISDPARRRTRDPS
jgi:hypothetical protein